MDSFLSALSVPYFIETSKKILDGFFQKYGFCFDETNEDKIVYYKDNIFIEFYYYPEDAPNYSLIIGIGFIKNDKGLTGYEGVGLWNVIHQQGDLINYKDRMFSSREELERNLIRIRNEIIPKYAKLLWENPNKLKNVIDEQLNRNNSKYRKQNRTQKLRQAKKAFRSGLYKEAVKIFKEIGISNLFYVELIISSRAMKHQIKISQY